MSYGSGRNLYLVGTYTVVLNNLFFFLLQIQHRNIAQHWTSATVRCRSWPRRSNNVMLTSVQWRMQRLSVRPHFSPSYRICHMIALQHLVTLMHMLYAFVNPWTHTPSRSWSHCRLCRVHCIKTRQMFSKISFFVHPASNIRSKISSKF